LLAAAIGGAAWLLPGHPPLSGALAFGLGLLAAAMFGETLVGAAGGDPYAVLRQLPVGVRPVWAARAALACGAALAIRVLQAPAALALPPRELALYVGAGGGANLSVALLGATYGVTLFPRVDAARRLYGVALGLSLAASVMMPLAGWLVL